VSLLFFGATLYFTETVSAYFDLRTFYHPKVGVDPDLGQ
jgi:hypothetical protein